MKKTIAMIPARKGSTRLPCKNLALLDGEPLVAYSIRNARESGSFDTVVLNADDKSFKEIADRYGCDFYLRPAHLGGSMIKSDDVVYDFMEKYPSECTVWVNPTSPLQTPSEINRIVSKFLASGADTLFTTNNYQVHGCLKDQPVNFTLHNKFAQTQDLPPIQLFVYSLMIWRNSLFQENYRRNQEAFFSGNLLFEPASREAGIIIKTAEDLKFAETFLRGKRAMQDSSKIDYDPLAHSMVSL